MKVDRYSNIGVIEKKMTWNIEKYSREKVIFSKKIVDDY